MSSRKRRNLKTYYTRKQKRAILDESMTDKQWRGYCNRLAKAARRYDRDNTVFDPHCTRKHRGRRVLRYREDLEAERNNPLTD